MYEPILNTVAEQIRASKDLKPILYLITEDREIIHKLLERGNCFDVIKDGKREQYCKGKEYDNITWKYGHEFKGTTKWNDLFRFDKGPQYHIFVDWNIMESNMSSTWTDIITNYINLLEKSGNTSGKNLVIVSASAPGNTIPEGYDQFVQVIDVPLLGMYEIAEMVVKKQNEVLSDEVLSDFLGGNEAELSVETYLQNPDTYTAFLKGMNRKQMEYVLGTLISQFGICSMSGLSDSEKQQFYDDKGENELDRAARESIFELKQQMVCMDGTLAFLDTSDTVKPGGMDGLEAWLSQAKEILDNPTRAEKYAVKFPKGILLAGLPGSGKSLLAKYVATILDIPLIQFKMSAILGGFVGDTEKNLARVLKMIEASAPCVVWIDEIEKELPNKGSSDKDSGVSKRCLATILNWMQENKKQCFICATANYIGSLPSELLRRGRFARKYYTFLPMQKQCVEILVTHLKKTAQKAPELFDKTIVKGKNGEEVEVDTKKLEEVCNKVFEQIAGMKRKFFTGADLEGLVEDMKEMLFSSNDSILPCNDEKLVQLLVYVAKKSKPYGETNFHEIVEYWCDMHKNPFLNVGAPETIGVPEDFSKVDDSNKIYKYVLFDFTDIQFNGKEWKWREGLKCASEKKYDRNMFDELKDPILQQMNQRVKKE